uniref:Uncharacterized protein n=1 Tax=Parascaris univalens TaxID=6257 RepID=A0A914ZTM8_PARUN
MLTHKFSHYTINDLHKFTQKTSLLFILETLFSDVVISSLRSIAKNKRAQSEYLFQKMKDSIALSVGMSHPTVRKL